MHILVALLPLFGQHGVYLISMPSPSFYQRSHLFASISVFIRCSLFRMPLIVAASTAPGLQLLQFIKYAFSFPTATPTLAEYGGWPG